MITKIKKRDGRTANFDLEKITQAIYKAAQAIGGTDYETAEKLAKENKPKLIVAGASAYPRARYLSRTATPEQPRSSSSTAQSAQE